MIKMKYKLVKKKKIQMIDGKTMKVVKIKKMAKLMIKSMIKWMKIRTINKLMELELFMMSINRFLNMGFLKIMKFIKELELCQLILEQH